MQNPNHSTDIKLISPAFLPPLPHQVDTPLRNQTHSLRNCFISSGASSDKRWITTQEVEKRNVLVLDQLKTSDESKKTPGWSLPYCTTYKCTSANGTVSRTRVRCGYTAHYGSVQVRTRPQSLEVTCIPKPRPLRDSLLIAAARGSHVTDSLFMAAKVKLLNLFGIILLFSTYT